MNSKLSNEKLVSKRIQKQVVGDKEILKTSRGQRKEIIVGDAVKNARVVQSFLIDSEEGQCCFCGDKLKAKRVLDNMKRIQHELKFMRDENFEVKQEIDSLCQNFSYILELASINIESEIKKKLKEILEEKNQKISKQYLKIQRMEEDYFELVSLTGEIERSQVLVKDLYAKNQKLQNEIKMLRQVNSELKGSWEKQKKEPSVEMTTSSDKKIKNETETPTKTNLVNSDKNFTEYSSNSSVEGLSRIRSLDNLKLKIKKLKSQLQMKNP